MRRNYGRNETKFAIEHNAREEWVPIPVPDCGVPIEWVWAARERVSQNVRWKQSTDPNIRLRGRIYCACGYAMTSIVSGNENRKKSGQKRRYYVCSQHRKRGKCEHVKFHRLLETEETVMEDSYSEQQAEGLLTMDRLREKLAAIDKEREGLNKRLSELADGEEKIRRLEELPGLVEAYLRDLPALVEGTGTPTREYETVPAERTEDNPLGVYRLTPERIRHKDEEELETERREAQEARSQRFREVYSALGLTAVVHRDRSVELRWSGGCSEWHKVTSGCCIA